MSRDATAAAIAALEAENLRPVLLVESAAGRDAVSGVPDAVPEAYPGLVAVGEVHFSPPLRLPPSLPS